MSKKRIQSMGSYQGRFCRHKENAQRKQNKGIYPPWATIKDLSEIEKLKYELKRKKRFILNPPDTIYLQTGKGGLELIQKWLKTNYENIN